MDMAVDEAPTALLVVRSPRGALARREGVSNHEAASFETPAVRAPHDEADHFSGRAML